MAWATEETAQTAMTGPSAGFTVKLPTSDDGYIGLHYGYRTTNPFDGIHSIGLNIYHVSPCAQRSSPCFLQADALPASARTPPPAHPYPDKGRSLLT